MLVVTPGNEALELALRTDEAQKIADVSIAEPKLLETKAYTDQAAEGAYDLIIYDQCAPRRCPPATRCSSAACRRPAGRPRGRGKARRWSSTPTRSIR